MASTYIKKYFLNCSLYTVITATDQKPQKSYKKAMLTTLT